MISIQDLPEPSDRSSTGCAFSTECEASSPGSCAPRSLPRTSGSYCGASSAPPEPFPWLPWTAWSFRYVLPARQFHLCRHPVAEFLLNGLHLFVQIVLALGLLHLPLHAAADAFFDLQNVDLAFHRAKTRSSRLALPSRSSNSCFLRDLQREVRRNVSASLAGSSI